MAENKQREGFTFYRSFRDTIEQMGTETEQLQMYKILTNSALDGIDPDPDTLTQLGRLCWTALRPNVHAGRTNWLNGLRGGAPKGNKNAVKTPEKQPKNNRKTSNENDNENDNDNVNENRDSKKSVARFTPPTLEEVRQYIAENGYNLVDADVFYNHYEAKGWKVGKNTMKDWMASVRSWQSREKKQTPQQSVSTTKSVREWMA